MILLAREKVEAHLHALQTMIEHEESSLLGCGTV
jgi:hypothetical protein